MEVFLHFFSFSLAYYTKVLQRMVQWCSGYHVCLTRRRSRARTSLGNIFTFKWVRIYVPQSLCFPNTMFPGPMFPGTYVPQYLCSPVSIFPCPMLSGTYVPQHLCSPVSMFPRPMFICVYVPQ